MTYRNQSTTYRKQRNQQSSGRSIWSYIFFNPRTDRSFDTWKLIFESNRLCREVDRDMKRRLTPQQYQTYINYGKPERKPNWWDRLLGRNT